MAQPSATQPIYSNLLARYKRECEAKLADSSSQLQGELDDMFANIDVNSLEKAAKSFLSGSRDSFDACVDGATNVNDSKMCLSINSSKRYRCRTCQKHESMSLCEKCFDAGPHRAEQHNFLMYSYEGFGTCDCGNDEVMLPGGFCSHHKQCDHASITAGQNTEQLDAFLYSAERLVPRLLTRVVQHIRSELDVRELASLCNVLVSLSSCGSRFVDLLARCLLDIKFYSQTEDQNASGLIQETRRLLLPDDQLQRLPEGCKSYFSTVYSCLLDELMFWLVALRFPRGLVGLVLSCFSNCAYRVACCRAFARHYALSVLLYWRDVQNPRTDAEEQESSECDNVHYAYFTDNIFKNASLVLQLREDVLLLGQNLAMFPALLELDSAFEPCRLAPCTCNLRVVSVGKLLESTSYTHLGYDLVQLLKNRSVALFVLQTDLFEQLLSNVSLWQACAVFERRTKPVKDISNGELHMCYKPMFYLAAALLQHDHDKPHEASAAALQALVTVTQALQHWLLLVDLIDQPACGTSLTDSHYCTFHIPLHRYFTTFLAVALRFTRGENERDALTYEAITSVVSPSLCYYVLQHVLDVLSCHFWLLSDDQHQSETDYFSAYCKQRSASFNIDLDLLLLQYCASQIDADCLLKLFVDKFLLSRVCSFFSFRQLKLTKDKSVSVEQSRYMLDSLYTVLVWLHTVPVSWLLDADKADETERVLRRQLVAHVSKESELVRLINALPPDGFTISTIFHDLKKKTTAIIGDVAVPESYEFLTEYELTPQVWRTEYDPAYTLLRFGTEGYDVSLARYHEKAKLEETADYLADWPPLRVPSRADYLRFPIPIRNFCLLRCSSFYSLIFIALDHAVDHRWDQKLSMHFAVHLLCIALAYREYAAGERVHLDADYKPTAADVVQDLQLEDWYPASIVDDPLKCVLHRIGRVQASFGAYSATCRVNKSILQLLVKVSRSHVPVPVPGAHVPRRKGLGLGAQDHRASHLPNESASDSLFPSGANIVRLLDYLSQRSSFIANYIQTSKTKNC